jgi:hypothetical protein
VRADLLCEPKRRPSRSRSGAGGPPPEYTIEQTQTDAYVFLTVYPTTFNLRDADYSTLGQQLKNYTEVYNRTVFLRFAPEMYALCSPVSALLTHS